MSATGLSSSFRHDHTHTVQFYGDDGVLLHELKGYIGKALIAGSSAIIIATPAHNENLASQLKSQGVNLGKLREEGRYIAADASQVLSEFMVDGLPDRAQFSDSIGRLISQAAAASRDENHRVVAFGEMVALLWAEGKPAAALELEKLWNELANTYSFSLHCAYPMQGFCREELTDAMLKISAEHTGVVGEGLDAKAVSEKGNPARTSSQDQAAPEVECQQKEEAFRLFVESVQDYAIFMLDAAGQVTTWNAGAARIKGYRAAEIIGRHFSCFYPEEDVQAGKPQRLLELAARESRIEEESWRVRKDGSKFWASVTITALKDEAGKLIGFGKVTRDLTEKRRTEQALRRSEERSRLFLEGVQDYAIFTLDPEGCVSTWNMGAQRIKGYRASEIIGRHFSCFYSGEVVRSGKPHHELELAKRHGLFAEEGWRIRKDGSKFWASVTIIAIKDELGNLLGFGKVTRDLTERKLGEDLLRETEQRFRLLVECVQDYAIFMLDPEGRVVTWNIGAERIKGYSASEIVGKHFSRFYTYEDVRSGKPARELELAARNGRVEDEGWRVRRMALNCGRT